MRQADLKQQAVDEDEVAEGRGAVDDGLRRHVHHGRQPHAENGVLTEVEGRQRRLRLDRRALEFFQRLVQPRGFVGLVGEQLDRFVVDQRVHDLAPGGGLGAVHRLAYLCPPVGHRDGEGGVRDDGADGDGGVGAAHGVRQDAADEGNLEGRGHHVEEHRAEGKVDRPVCARRAVGGGRDQVTTFHAMGCRGRGWRTYREPRSMARAKAPVWRSRWNCMSSACKCVNTSLDT